MNSIPNHMATATDCAQAARPAASWIGRPTCIVARPKVDPASPPSMQPSAP